ncbi:MAG: NAD(P)H-dependent oxidoreductase [Proteobacteria bacterium]|nr:MAG: NAD(P)H-dependent oxidoreductase [Pseudomonadota bacterium]
MKTLPPSDLLASLEWRYAAKSFAPEKKIPADTWAALEQSLVLTASSYGLQPWQFLVVQDKGLREQLRAASWNQRQITECSHLVVFTVRPHFGEEFVDQYMKLVSEARGVPIENLAGFKRSIMGDVGSEQRQKGMPEWNARQCYIALGNFLTSAALLGVDTCPMEGLDPKKYDEILGLEATPFRTVVVCAAGYRNPEDKLGLARKVRFPKEAMVRYL